MDLLRAVDRQADEEVVLLEERCPPFVDQHTVGLDGVLHLLPWLPVRPDEFDGTLEEVVDEKKQKSQSRLQIGPVGLANM